MLERSGIDSDWLIESGSYGRADTYSCRSRTLGRRGDHVRRDGDVPEAA